MESPTANTEVIVAHGDSILLKVRDWMTHHGSTFDNYFVYRAGASRPPSLSLFPAKCYLNLYVHNTGILRCDADEVQVVHFKKKLGYGPKDPVDLSVLNLTRNEWEVKPSLPVVQSSNGSKEPMTWNVGHIVIPVGDRFLFWVDYRSGLVV